MKTDEQLNRIYELQAAGATQEAIAKELGVSRARVRQIQQARPEQIDIPELGDINQRMQTLLRVWFALAERNAVGAMMSFGSSRAKGRAVIAAVATDKILAIRAATGMGVEDNSAVGRWLNWMLENSDPGTGHPTPNEQIDEDDEDVEHVERFHRGYPESYGG